MLMAESCPATRRLHSGTASTAVGFSDLFLPSFEKNNLWFTIAINCKRCPSNAIRPFMHPDSVLDGTPIVYHLHDQRGQET